MKRNAVAYARISDATEKHNKVASQIKALDKLADRSGYNMADTFPDNDISALHGTELRPEFERLLRELYSGQIDVVLATEQSRLTRGSAIDAERFIEACRRGNTIVHFLRGGINELKTAKDRYRFKQDDNAGGFEVEQNQERQAERFDEERERGRYLWGPRPLAFVSARSHKLVPEEAEMIRAAYADLLAGTTNPYRLAQEWNDANLRTSRAGKKYTRKETGKRHKTTGLWTRSSVRKTLLKARNAGLIEHRGAILGEMLTPKGKPVPETVVTRQQWEDLTRLIGLEKRGSRGPKAQTLLTGILRCTCGGSLSAATSASKHNGKVYSYPTYGCSNRGVTPGPHTTVRRDIADDAVRRSIIDAHVSATRDQLPNKSVAELSALAVRVEQIDMARARLVKLIAKPTAEEGTYSYDPDDDALLHEDVSRELVELKRERVELMERRDQIMASTASLRMLSGLGEKTLTGHRVSFAKAAEWRTQVGERFDSLSMEDRRQLVRSFLDVKLQPGRGAERIAIEHLIVKHLNDQPPGAMASRQQSTAAAERAKKRREVESLNDDAA